MTVKEPENQNQGNDVVLGVTLSVDPVRVMALSDLVNSYNELRQAFLKYGSHMPDCDIFVLEEACNCGLHDLMKKYDS